MQNSGAFYTYLGHKTFFPATKSHEHLCKDKTQCVLLGFIVGLNVKRRSEGAKMYEKYAKCIGSKAEVLSKKCRTQTMPRLPYIEDTSYYSYPFNFCLEID